jgi:hypothetical protein
MVTTNEVKRSLDKAYDDLSPEERARVTSAGGWMIADMFARGEDIHKQEQEQRRFIDQYVNTLTNYQYIHFLIALADRDEAEWGKRYFYDVIQGLVRENSLISLLLLNLDRRWSQEIICTRKNGDGWIESRDRLAEQITILRERKRAIAAEIDAIFKSEFWEVRNIERPSRPDIDPAGLLT